MMVSRWLLTRSSSNCTMQSWDTWAKIQVQNRCIKVVARTLRWKTPSREGPSRSLAGIHSSQWLLVIPYNPSHVSSMQTPYYRLLPPRLFVIFVSIFSPINWEMVLQTIYVPKHATAVIAHFFRLEKFIGFCWSPSSNSTYNKYNDRFGSR